MTKKANYAGFAWFAIWFLGLIAYVMLYTSVPNFSHDHWSMLSLYHTLGKVQTVIFGLPNASGEVPSVFDAFPSVILLAGITIVSVAVIYRRISSPMRI